MKIKDLQLFTHERDEAYNTFLDQYNVLPHTLICSHRKTNKLRPLREFIKINQFVSLKSYKVMATYKVPIPAGDLEEDDDYEDDDYSNIYVNDSEKIIVNFRYSDVVIYYPTLDQPMVKAMESILDAIKEPIVKYPRIYLLCMNSGGFYIKEIKIKNLDNDYLINYKEDFKEVHKSIVDKLKTNKSGIILLHGTPGTGKTSYIKNLTGEVDRKFIVIPQTLIGKLSTPEFTTFLVSTPDAVLVLEDAEPALITRDVAHGRSSSVSELLNLSDGLVGQALNCAIIATFNTSMDNIDEAIVRKGRLVAEYRFDPLTMEEANVLLKRLDKPQNATPNMTLADIYNIDVKVHKSSKKRQAIGFSGPRA